MTAQLSLRRGDPRSVPRARALSSSRLLGKARSSSRRILVGTALVVCGLFPAAVPLRAATGDVISSFPAPGTRPFGLAWDGTNLWHADRQADQIYELTTTGTVLSSFPTPGGRPSGLTWDGTNLWHTDQQADQIYELTTTGTVLSSFAAPCGAPRGLTFDGTNLWLACDGGADVIYQLTTTGTVLSSFPTPGTSPDGLTWDGTNLWHADRGTDLIYQLTTSGTVLSSFAAPCNVPHGLTWDGNNFWQACDGNIDTIYQLEGPPPTVTLGKSVSPTGDQPPGALLTYTVDHTNTGPSEAFSLVTTDPIPANTDFQVGSASFSPGSSGLTATIAYSNDNGASYTYTPVSGGGGAPAGFDRNVTHLRWTFTGTLSSTPPNHTFSTGFTVRIR